MSLWQTGEMQRLCIECVRLVSEVQVLTSGFGSCRLDYSHDLWYFLLCSPSGLLFYIAFVLNNNYYCFEWRVISMNYEELKEYVGSQLPETSKLTIMKRVIDDIASEFFNLKNKLTEDLNIDENQNNINVAKTGNRRGTVLSIGDRQIKVDYDGDSHIEVIVYEPGVLDATKIDDIIYRDGKAVYEGNGELFDLKSIESYLDWFKK